ncbi:MAG: hypothetical protein KF905_04620 [Flavobacteriales bacterium]|nr:hypothetical protein [Flavobacteriales bacterium]
MELSHIRKYTHKHCRFRLRSGKEVFGVIWEVETRDLAPEGDEPAERHLFFASIRDYERLQHQGTPVHVIPMQPDEIVMAESIAS